MIPLGTIAPDFQLPDVISGKRLSYNDAAAGGRATVVMFICNHCPYVQVIENHVVNFARQYQAKGVSFVAISSSDAEQYPQDGPEEMKKRAVEKGYPFPYLYDETQDVACAYHAACTPDFFVFDADRRCVYRGQYDEARRDNGVPVTGADLGRALDCILEGRPVPAEQIPSLGCNIKWKTDRVDVNR